MRVVGIELSVELIEALVARGLVADADAEDDAAVAQALGELLDRAVGAR